MGISYMTHKLTRFIGAALFSFFLSVNQAHAIIDLQIQYGPKETEFSGDLKGDKSKGNNLHFSGHFTLPIPIVRFGLGLAVSATNYKLNDTQGVNATKAGFTFDGTFSELQGYGAGPDLVLGIGIPLSIQLYARATYLFSAMTAKGSFTSTEVPLEVMSDQSVAMSGTGTEFGFGIGFTPIPLLHITFEYLVSDTKMDTDEINKSSEAFTLPKMSGRMKSTAMMIGLMFDI